MATTAEGQWLEHWSPVLLPMLVLFGRIAVSWSKGAYVFARVPADLCYYGFTFYLWALTTKLKGGRVSPRELGGGEAVLIQLFLILNLIMSIVMTFPIQAPPSSVFLFVSVVLGVTIGLGSPFYIMFPSQNP